MALKMNDDTKALTAVLLDVIAKQNLEDKELVNVLGTLVGYFLATLKTKRATMEMTTGYVHMEIGVELGDKLGRIDEEPEVNA